MDEYVERNALLVELGYKDYHAYLRSKLWKEIRARKLAAEPECYGCCRDATKATMQVHHGQYTRENLTGQSEDHLFSICSRCHHWIEVTRNGYKRTPAQATKELFRVRKLHLQRSHFSRPNHSVQPPKHPRLPAAHRFAGKGVK